MRISCSLALMDPTSGSRSLCAVGRRTGSLLSKRPDGERLFRWCFSPVRRSSSIGARTGVTPEACFKHDIGSERVKLQVAHIKLSHSRAFLVRAYLLQTHEMLFDAHWHAFRVFDGIPGRGIYDSETLFAIGSRTMVERRPQWTELMEVGSAM